MNTKIKKHVLIEQCLAMAWHGFMAASQKTPSLSIKKETTELAISTAKLLKDFRKHGEFTQEEY